MDKMNKGLSLIEILVVVTIFAVLGILVTQSVILTVRGSKKSETLVRVRENLNYAMGVVERQLRNSDSIPACQSQPSVTRIDYTDQEGNPSYFLCQGLGGEDSYIASESARLTSSETVVVSCSFECNYGTGTTPPSVTINFSAKDANALGSESSLVTISNQIFLRNY